MKEGMKVLQKVREVTNRLLLSENISKEKKQRLELISNILKDDQCFFKIDVDTAYNIIRDLGFSHEETKSIYKELISSKNFN